MKKLIKRAFYSVFVSALLLSFSGCGKPEKKPESGGGRVICCTTFPVWLFTRNIVSGVPGVSAELVIPASSGCPHDYALTASDVRRLSRRGIMVVCNGGGLDEFVLELLKRVNPAAPVIDASSGLKGLAVRQPRHHEHHHDRHASGHHDEHHHDRHDHFHPGAVNPHFFASPDIAAKMVNNIASKLAETDPANASRYAANAEAYTRRLEALAQSFRLAAGTGKARHVLCQHEAFDYLAVLLDWRVVGDISPEGVAPAAGQLRRRAEEIREHEVSLIITEVQYSGQEAEILSRETGVPCLCLDPVASGPENAPADYYETVMRGNLEKISGVLK